LLYEEEAVPLISH
jgi:hypothetical protein